MKRQFVPFAAAAVMLGSSAGADPFVDAVVRNFQDMGYQFVEIERGRTQLKAEGVRGSDELEVVYDLATGRIIRQETGRADDDYIGRSGVEIDVANRDFVGDDDDDDDDDRDDDRDDDDDDEDDRSGSRDDDDDDDNGRSGSGRDDDDDDDNDRSGSGRDDNDDGDDDSGSDDNDDDNDDDGNDDSGSDDNDDDDD